MGLFSSSKNRTTNNNIFQDHRQNFEDSFNTDIEFDDNRDLSTDIEVGDNNIFTQGNVNIERLDDDIVRAAIDSVEKIGQNAILSNERVVSGALSQTTGAIKDLSEKSQNNFALLTETIGDEAADERDFALGLASKQIEAGLDGLALANQSTIGGLTEIQAESTRTIVTVMVIGLVAILIFGGKFK